MLRRFRCVQIFLKNKPGANTAGEKKNREESRQKEAGMKVACKEHRRQEGIQEGKTKRQKANKSEINKGQLHYA